MDIIIADRIFIYFYYMGWGAILYWGWGEKCITTPVKFKSSQQYKLDDILGFILFE